MLFLESYAVLNFTLIIGALVSMLLVLILEQFFDQFSSAQVLTIQYLGLLTSVLSFFVIYFTPEARFESPMPQNFTSTLVGIKTNLVGASIISSNPEVKIWGLNWGWAQVFTPLILMVMGYKVFNLLRAVKKTLRQTREGLLYKRLGKVSIYISNKFSTPYAFSFVGRSYVSVPESVVGNAEDLSIIVKHELQHIRNKDTVFSFVGEALKALFFLNPILLKWIDYVCLTQEFSCDEALILKKKVISKSYKSCLLRVAELGRSQNMNLVGATGFIFGKSRSELSRRIIKMSKEKKRINKVIMAGFLLASLSVISTAAYTINVHAAIGKLSLNEVRSLVKKKDFSKDFPLDINKKVVEQVNRLARTKKGIKYTRQALSNYYGHKAMLTKHISDYGYPAEIAAIPFVESQYKNLPQPKEKHIAAGMWQFIPGTARAYNLKVVGRSKKNDERLDIIKETDAAMRYLGALNLRFQDWRLAMLSYNAGETEVQRVINKTKSRDVWKLTKNGLKYDKNYLAKVMAAAIIIKYPEIVK